MTDPTKSRFRYFNLKSDNAYRRYISEGDSTKLINGNHSGNTIEVPAHGSYGALLFRPEWRARREQIINRDKVCVICRSNENLQVHHRQYHFVVRDNNFRLPWEYEDRLLITLCEPCHKKGHSQYKVPTVNL